MLADAEGRQYEVFTPEEGGRFDGGDVTISADPGAVPNLEIVGVRVDAAGPASNVGHDLASRYTLVGDKYDVLAVDAIEAAISSYVLNSPLEVCLPLPPACAARHLGRGDSGGQPRRHADGALGLGADRAVGRERVRQSRDVAGDDSGRHRGIAGCDTDGGVGSG